MAPDFQIHTISEIGADSPQLSLHDLHGRLVYLDFWASWCGPCKQSFPWMNSLQQQYKAKGLDVLAVNLDEHPEDARRFLTQFPAHFRVAFDSAGALPRQYAIQGMPTSVLISPEGRVLMVHAGFRPDDMSLVESAIQKALPH